MTDDDDTATPKLVLGDISTSWRRLHDPLRFVMTYGPAVRAYLRAAADDGATLADLADTIDVEDIAAHLYTKGQPDPELVIRTSGEQRVGGFLMWQSAHSELYFCEAYWPDFRRVDFLRALRDYSRRERRLGR